MNALQIIVLLVLSSIVFSCTDKQPEAKNPPKQEQDTEQQFSEPAPQLNVGAAAPDIVMNDINGKSFSLSSLKGKVVMLDFWATWCPPCVRSIPEAKNLWASFKNKEFAMVGISLDKDLDTWKSYVKEQQMGWIHIADGKFWDNQGALDYGIGSIPSVWIIDKDGNIALKDVNPLSESEIIKSTITELLNKK